VHHAATVGIPERRADLGEDVLHHENRELPELLDDVVERFPLHVLHDEEERRLGLLDRVDRDDVRMRELRGRAGLELEPVRHPLALEQVGRHDLDGDPAIEGDVMRQEDGCHAAAAQLAQDLVLAERRVAQDLAHGRLDARRGRAERGDFERLRVGPVHRRDLGAALRAEERALHDRGSAALTASPFEPLTRRASTS
jgi:hypothetical protein